MATNKIVKIIGNSQELEMKKQRFNIGQTTKYQFADISRVGYWATDLTNKYSNRVFEILSSKQVVIGLPVMDVVWEYKVFDLSSGDIRTFLEPELTAN